MKPFDVSKFVKGVTKSVPGMSVGFRDPDTWISTGCYALNYCISSRFKDGGVPLGKVSVLSGDSGSGKSLIASGNIISNAQKQGIYVFAIDTENALDDKWLTDLEVNTNPEYMMKFNMSIIDDVSKVFFEFIKGYKAEHANTPYEDRPKVLWVIDSLGMLETNGAAEKVQNGDMRGDMGLKAKQLKAMVTQMVSAIAMDPIGVVATNHAYANQDAIGALSNPLIVSGGSGFIYASSILVTMQKFLLKEDEDGNKISDATGIRAKCVVSKTRYAKPFQKVVIKVPYDKGMNPYSGLVEMLKTSEVLTKTGNRWEYIDVDTGESTIMFEKAYNRNDKGILDTIMEQYARHPAVAKFEAQIAETEESLVEYTDDQENGE